jgi:hypothetical protein
MRFGEGIARFGFRGRGWGVLGREIVRDPSCAGKEGKEGDFHGGTSHADLTRARLIVWRDGGWTLGGRNV